MELAGRWDVSLGSTVQCGRVREDRTMRVNIYALPPAQYLKWRYAHPNADATKLLETQQHEVSVFLTVLWMKEYYDHQKAT